MQKKKILIIADHFKPGYKAGGPIQSLFNLTSSLSRKHEIYLVNKNHDFKEEDVPYEGIKANEWKYSDTYSIWIYYMSPKNFTISRLQEIYKSIKPDFIYLNSFFSPQATIKPLLALPFSIPSKVILAPRGELNTNALKIKSTKKLLYLMFFNFFLKRKVFKYHATSIEEENNVIERLGKSRVEVISNLPYQGYIPFNAVPKEDALANFVMISRIATIKNIDYLLDVLNTCAASISIDLYGIIEDKKYWELCKSKINNLPKNVTVTYKGMLNSNQIFPTLKKYRFFISSTKGENFGHSIFEAMIAGKPVIVSDKTPWRALEEKGIGWDISLKDTKKWQRTLEYCENMSNETYTIMAQKTYNYAEDFKINSQLNKKYGELFS